MTNSTPAKVSPIRDTRYHSFSRMLPGRTLGLRKVAGYTANVRSYEVLVDDVVVGRVDGETESSVRLYAGKRYGYSTADSLRWRAYDASGSPLTFGEGFTVRADAIHGVLRLIK